MASPTPPPSVSAASRPSCRPAPDDLSLAEAAKQGLITAACEAGDIAALAALATSTHGLVSDSLRRTAWPLLLGCAITDADAAAAGQIGLWKELPPHRDEPQVALDVNRAFVYYPTHNSEKELDRRKHELSNVILEVLRRHSALAYFQGYHDIVQVLYLVLGPHAAPQAAARLSLLRIRDFMLSSLEPAIAQLELLRPLLRNADPLLYEHLPQTSAAFALAGTITMFAHNIQAYKDITRLFDFFLAQHAAMPLYFFAAVALSRRDELLEIDKEDEDILHVVLGKLPDPFHVEYHIARAAELYASLPPNSLRSRQWWRISSASVLKTSPTLVDIRKSTLQDGERYFAQQEKELCRKQYQKKLLQQANSNINRLYLILSHHRRYGYAGIAIAVGAYALWLGRNGGGDITSFPIFEYLGIILQRPAGV